MKPSFTFTWHRPSTQPRTDTDALFLARYSQFERTGSGRYVEKTTGKSCFSGKNHWKKRGLFLPTNLSTKRVLPFSLNVVLKKKIEKTGFPKKRVT
jgi:hypothetical protein